VKKLNFDFFLFFQALGWQFGRRPDVITPWKSVLSPSSGFFCAFLTSTTWDPHGATAGRKMSFLKRSAFLPLVRRRLPSAGDCRRAVCDALAKIAEPFKPKYMKVLTDISLLAPTPAARRICGRNSESRPAVPLCRQSRVYQGIDLLLESVALASASDRISFSSSSAAPRITSRTTRTSHCVSAFRTRALRRPRPDPDGRSFQAADVLVLADPRRQHTMKIYSYMDSGRASSHQPVHAHAGADARRRYAGEPRPDAFARP